ncbi:hypothetical protein BGX24_004119 [Mortierella sp. AD032]|nr:hypothetical protein BGX24_004119 [Mortierella sp. AD032]
MHDHSHRRARSPSVTQQHHRTPEPTAPQQQLHHHLQSQQETRDELALGDAQEEIRRLNAMVDELERLIRVKMNV